MRISPYNALKQNSWPFPPPSKTSIPELFIIESMDDDDEKAGFFEGVRLAQILRLGGRNPKYYYVQDERELELLVPVFRQSNYRYLHFSCHGDEQGFFLTNGPIGFDRFAEIFGETLKLRRLFVSACQSGQEELVKALHKNARGIQSVTAPRVKIDYDHAAAIWSAVYLSLLEQRAEKCKHEDIIKRIALMIRLFPYSNVGTRELMSFMFAGYQSNDDKEDGSTFPWVFNKISRTYNLNQFKKPKRTKTHK